MAWSVVRQAEQRLNREQERVANYLNSSSEDKLLKVVNKELLEVHQER